jgi:hypothetical protein
MKRHCLLFIFFLLSAFTVIGKKSEIFKLSPTDSITTRASYNKVSVIDLRSDKDFAGKYLNRDVDFEDNLSASLKKLGLAIIQPASDKEQQELLIVVKDIELRTLSYIGAVHIRMDLYLGNDNAYRLAGKTDTLFEFPVGQRARQNLTIVTNYILTTSIIAAGKSYAEQISTVKAMDEILNDDNAFKQSHGIYFESPKKGIYYTYQQFLDNTPVDTVFGHDHYFNYNEHVDNFYLLNEKGKHRKNLSDTAYFAVVDNGRCYKMAKNGGVYEMKMRNGEWSYIEIFQGIPLTTGMNPIGYQFGALGSLLYAGISTLDNRSALDSKKVKLESGEYWVRLDPVTGEIFKTMRIR